MTEDIPGNEGHRRAGDDLDQRQGQIDPAGKHRTTPGNAPAVSTKQPGGRDDRQKGKDSATGSDKARQKRADPGKRQNAQGDHAGAPHSPEEFDVMNPQKPGSSQENT